MLKSGLLLIIIFTTSSYANFPFFFKPASQDLTTLCTDFYHFACANWLKQEKKPDFEPIWNPWIAMSHKINRRLATILTNHNAGNRTALSKAQMFYNVCLKTTNHERRYLQNLVLLVERLGGWPLIDEKWEKHGFDWLKQVCTINRLLGIHPILKIHVELDYKHPQEYIIYFEPGNFIFPSYILMNSSYFQDEIEIYKKWIFESVKHLYQVSIDRNLIADLVKFEISLAGLVTKSRTDRTTVGKLSNKFGPIWGKSLNLLFENITKITSNTPIIIKNNQYLKNLLRLLGETPTEVVANYLIWSVIKDLSRDTSNHMKDLNFLVDHNILGVEKDLNAIFECVGKTVEFLGNTLIPPYVISYINPKIFKPIHAMIASIKSEFVHLLNNSWMDKSTKLLTIEKIQKIRVNLGFPLWLLKGDSLEIFYENLKISDNHFWNIIQVKNFTSWLKLSKLGKPRQLSWPSSPFQVNAYYSILQNSIFIPLGLLEPPFFHISRPSILNYGALGALIGHELAHALDPAGILANSDGKITNWWPEQDLAIYKNRSHCFQKDDSFGENIADGVGLRVSYAAAQLSHKNKKTFFVSYTQMWCEISRNFYDFGNEGYAPISVRINRNLGNNRNFVYAFHCNSNTFCELW